MVEEPLGIVLAAFSIHKIKKGVIPMGITITLSKVKLVRESSHRYGNIESRKISEPIDAVKVANEVLELENLAQELFGVLFLDVRNKITGIMEVSRGSVNSSIATPREVFKGAVLHNAVSILLFHNHPSGDPTPSREDTQLTRQMQKAGELMQISVLDHVIIGNGCFTSLKEADLM